MLRNIRYGHATNSSSAHSVIFSRACDNNLESTLMSEVEEYARDRFVFRTAHEKAVFAFHSMGNLMTSNHELLELKRVLKDLDIEEAQRIAKAGDLPFEGGMGYFFRNAVNSGIPLVDWLRFIFSEDVAIIGYDDNDGAPHEELIHSGLAYRLDDNMLFRADRGAIIGYDPRRGTKFRWSADPYEKSTTPELVDIKITDFCGYGCKFCYQGSTTEGQHAPLKRIEAILDEMKEMGVFEVAIGGGEPAHHPEFAKIIRAATERKITFNFTAFGLDWLKNAEVLQAMKDSRGMGVGLSVHSARDLVKVERARKALKEAGTWHVEVMAQTVVGATPLPTIEKMMDTAAELGTPLLLLGYKTTGRGAEFSRKKVSDNAMKGLLLKAREYARDEDRFEPFTLSVDTAFLDSYGHVLEEINVPRVLRTSPEGKFSMYIDAVENRCGPSSYCDPAMMEPIGDIKAQFAQW